MTKKSIINYLTLTSVAFLFSPYTLADNPQSLEERVTALEAKAVGNGELWYNTLTFSGLMEMETTYTHPDSGHSSVDMVVATVELGLATQLTEDLSAELALLHEEDDTDLEVDRATISYNQSHDQQAFAFTMGQDYVPFGSYTTALVNDPLTLEIGETRETAFTVNYENGPFAGAFYLFNGDQDEDERDWLNNFGGRITLTNNNLTLGADYTSNLADADSLQDNDYGYSTGEDVVAGFTLYGQAVIDKVQLAIEHLGALDNFAGDGNNSQPAATQVEVSFEAGDFTYAIAYQQTDEALFLELPEARISLGLSTEVLGGLGLGLELTVDDDYAIADGGTGDTTNSVVLQLAAEF